MNKLFPRVFALASILVLASGCDAAVTVIPAPVGGGSLYGIHETNFVKIDPSTAEITILGPLPPEASPLGGEVLDNLHRRYVYSALDYDANEWRLISLDLDSGAVVANVLLPRNVSALAVEGVSGDIVFHYIPDETSDERAIGRIDPILGTLTQLSTYVPPWNYVNSADMIYDGAGTFYGVAPILDQAAVPTNVYTFGAATGVWAGAEIPVPGMHGLEFDPGLDLLVATSSVITEHVEVVTVDRSTLAVDHVAVLDAYAAAGADAYDPVTHRYFVVAGEGQPKYFADWYPGFRLYTVDIETGHVLGESPVIGTEYPIYGLRYAL